LPEGVPDSVDQDIKRRALRAFRICTALDEWIYAFDRPEMGAGPIYRFWPHRQEAKDPWLVHFWPNGDDYVFISQGFDWGVYAYCTYRETHDWMLYVFGQPLLDAFVGNWPHGWSNVLARHGAIPRSLP
jgi:hypothetical protein